MSVIQPKGSRVRSAAALYLSISVVVLLIATYLRLHNLGLQSLWNDEGNSYVQATRSFADIAANAARDIHPPGYYWLLAFWQRWTGDSEFALRALSAFASFLTVALTFAIGKRLFSPGAGLAAALLVALNTFSIYYAQEARMYALLGLWSAVGMWVLSIQLSAFSHQSKVKRIIALGFINAAGLYTQYAYPFVMLAQGAIVAVWVINEIISRRRYAGTRHALSLHNPIISVLIAFIFANVLALALYIPWLPTALKQVTSWPSTGQPIPALDALRTIGGWFMYGLTYSSAPYRKDDSVWMIVVFVGFGLVGGGLGKWNSRQKDRGVWRVALPTLWVVVPVALFLLLGLFRQANLKFLLPAQTGFALFVGLGLMRLWEGFRGWGWAGVHMAESSSRVSLILSRFVALLVTMMAFAVIVSLLPLLYTDPAYQRSDYRSMVAAINAQPRPGDAIILDAPNQEEVFTYYYHGNASIFPLPPGLGGNDAETLAAVQDVIAHYNRIFVLFWGEAERDPNHVVESTLDNETFQAGEDRWYGDVRFSVYAPPAKLLRPTSLNTHFGDHITLVDDALNATRFHPGDVLQIEFTWETDASLSSESPYKIFLQLLNKDGVLVAQRDTEPASGSRPTQDWKPGETIIDRHGLTIPADLPPDDYVLIVGLYDAYNPSARLPVGDGDYLVLTTIHVE